MRKSRAMATFAVAAVLGTAGAALAAVPEVSGVTMTQVALTRKVKITYDLAEEDAIITLSIETNGVAIPDSAVTRLSGDVCKKVAVGTGRTIIWHAGDDWPEHSVMNAKARVTAWMTNAPPQVMVIDLSKGTDATAQDPYPVLYYNALEALPDGGLSNDMYKTVMLVMNKIPSGGYDMGDESTSGASAAVTLSQTFYAGVYEVTQKQWGKVMGTEPSGFTNSAGPVNMVSYHDIRENPVTNKPLDPNWPQTNIVGTNSFMGRLRSRTGLTDLDLPTDAQWEYACRAGTTTYFNDGINGSAAVQLNALGWWSGNSGGSTHKVGQKTPNEWGLYDMHGNVREWCLDWYESALSGGDDPGGANSGPKRVYRGGSWNDPVDNCRSASRNDYYSPSGRRDFIGFRLVRTLP